MRLPREKQFKLVIRLDNAAFEDSPHNVIATLLKEVATHVESGYDALPIRDENGNRVGEYKTV